MRHIHFHTSLAAVTFYTMPRTPRTHRLGPAAHITFTRKTQSSFGKIAGRFGYIMDYDGSYTNQCVIVLQPNRIHENASWTHDVRVADGRLAVFAGSLKNIKCKEKNNKKKKRHQKQQQQNKTVRSVASIRSSL